MSELQQLHDREAFTPMNIKNLSPEERKRALDTIVFMVEKRDGQIKIRACTNGKKQRIWTDKNDTSSPTVSTEAVLLTAVIDAKEGRDVMTSDIPNAFVQTQNELDKDGEQVFMKIKGVLVDMLIELDPHKYKNKVVYEKGEKVLYLLVLKAIYGLLKSAMLFYKKNDEI